jgi:uncharacterized protein (DUF2267 family)
MTPASQPWEAALQKSNEWLNQLVPELDAEGTNGALLALRSVLHAVRDRLPPEEAVDLAAQLPLLIKGVYFDGWHPSRTPVKARTRDAFLGLVVRRAGGRITESEAERMTRAVFRLLASRVTAGEIEDVRGALPAELAEFWPAPAKAGQATVEGRS